MARKVFGVAIAVLIGQASASSMYIAKLCRGQTCTNPRFPILDYDPREGKCACHAHPCWDDNGKSHYCAADANPYLEFSYSAQKSLVCRCLDKPTYSSQYLMRDLCPGQNCERPDHPVMDYDERRRKCFCRAHPCMDVDGYEHSCVPGKVLRYREDESEVAGAPPKGVCECIPKMDPPQLASRLNSDL